MALQISWFCRRWPHSHGCGTATRYPSPWRIPSSGTPDCPWNRTPLSGSCHGRAISQFHPCPISGRAIPDSDGRNGTFKAYGASAGQSPQPCPSSESHLKSWTCSWHSWCCIPKLDHPNWSPFDSVLLQLSSARIRDWESVVGLSGLLAD